MKGKLLLATTLIVGAAAQSSAFYKMEGPWHLCCQTYLWGEYLSPVYSSNPSITQYGVFVYEPHTKIGMGIRLNEGYQKVSSFFEEFNLENKFELKALKLNKDFVIEPITEKKLIWPKPMNKIAAKVVRDIFDAKNYEDINFQASLNSLSNVLIRNYEDGKVSISRADKYGGREIYLQDALKKYMNKLSHYSTIADMLFSNKQNKNLIDYKIETVYTKDLYGPSSQDLLEKSNILSVLHLLNTTYSNKENSAEKKTVNQRMIFLCEDKETKEKFYAATNLGTDIEILLEQVVNWDINDQPLVIQKPLSDDVD